VTERQAAAAAKKGPQPNTGSNIKVAKPQMFDRTTNNILKFLTACRLYIRMRMRDAIVKEQL